MLNDAETPLTPDWWLIRLGRRLRARQPQLDIWRSWYTDQPLPRGPRKCSQAYLDFQRKARTNFCATVANSTVFRLSAIGITDRGGRSDDEAWGWWQANRLDARQTQVYRTATTQSQAYVIVGHHPRDERRPLITAEHPREVIVDVDPATGERRAALKAWHDDVGQVGRANLYIPGKLFRYVTERRGPGRLPWGAPSWTLMADPGEHDLGVPVVSFPCRPDLGEEPVAEFHTVIDIQERINLGILNRMTAERYSAFRQKYVTGHRFERTIDPETGLELIDPVTGRPQVNQPFVPDPGALWASEGEVTKFGEFSQTDLMGYLKAHEADIKDLLTISHTPAYYYAGDLINIGADTVSALDGLHLAKVAEHMAIFGEAWEEVLGLSATVAGVDRDFDAAEIRWQDPRQLNPGVLADMGTKLRSMGYPLGVVAERLGESPQQVQRITSAQAGEALLNSIRPAALAVPPVPAPAGG
jgi:Phage portal protein, SPP1 Gp6-like